MRLLVCGGTYFGNQEYFERSMRVLDRLRRITLIIEGGQAGADTMARYWANWHGRGLLTFKPDWRVGKIGGHMRNERMIIEGKPEGGVAFPGAEGTMDMVARLKAHGIPVLEL